MEGRNGLRKLPSVVWCMQARRQTSRQTRRQTRQQTRQQTRRKARGERLRRRSKLSLSQQEKQRLPNLGCRESESPLQQKMEGQNGLRKLPSVVWRMQAKDKPEDKPDNKPEDKPEEKPEEKDCVDDKSFRFRNKKNRDCQTWVAANPKVRCSKKWKGKTVSDHCPGTCYACKK